MTKTIESSLKIKATLSDKGKADANQFSKKLQRTLSCKSVLCIMNQCKKN